MCVCVRMCVRVHVVDLHGSPNVCNLVSMVARWVLYCTFKLKYIVAYMYCTYVCTYLVDSTYSWIVSTPRSLSLPHVQY